MTERRKGSGSQDGYRSVQWSSTEQKACMLATRRRKVFWLPRSEGQRQDRRARACLTRGRMFPAISSASPRESPPSILASPRAKAKLGYMEALHKQKQLQEAEALMRHGQWHDWLTARQKGKNRRRRIPITEERRKALRRAFECMDDDKSGDVSVEEVKGPLAAIGIDTDTIQSMMANRPRRGMCLDFESFEHLLLTVDRRAPAKNGPAVGAIRSITEADQFPFKLHVRASRIRDLIDETIASEYVAPAEARHLKREATKAKLAAARGSGGGVTRSRAPPVSTRG